MVGEVDEDGNVQNCTFHPADPSKPSKPLAEENGTPEAEIKKNCKKRGQRWVCARDARSGPAPAPAPGGNDRPRLQLH